MYKANEYKKQYYEKQLIQNYIKSESNIPSKALIEKKINSLDLNKSILQPYIVKTGDIMNPKKYMDLIGLLKEDLSILYKTLESYSLDDYYYLILYIRNNLEAVRKEVIKHKQMTKQLDYLGKTILFSNEFEYEDNIINISKNIDITNNANLLVSLTGLNYDYQPKLVIKNKNTVIIEKILTKDDNYISLPGTPIKPKKYIYQLSNFKTNQIELDRNKSYSIYDGRNKILSNNKAQQIPLTPIKVDEDTTIRFYTVDKETNVGISTSTPEKITQKNFVMFDNIISDFIYMKALKDCIFSIGNSNGVIYAKNYKVSNSSLLSLENTIDKSLLVYEYDKPGTDMYDIYIELPNDKRDILSNILIKEQ